MSHLLGSSMAATFVSPRLIVGFRFPTLVSLARSKFSNPLQQFNRFGRAACLPKAAGEARPQWGSFCPAAFVSQSGSSGGEEEKKQYQATHQEKSCGKQKNRIFASLSRHEQTYICVKAVLSGAAFFYFFVNSVSFLAGHLRKSIRKR